jgi:hypothetical protein
MLQALRHVETAIRHAESLAEEARDLREPALADPLEAAARELSAELEAACQALEEVEPAREARQLAHRALQSLYDDASLRIEERGDPRELARLTPGGYLDVSERIRFRLRRLEQESEPELLRLRDELERGLLAYETCVDAYLLAAGRAQVMKDGAVAQSQVFRLALERAKARLLTLAPAGSPTWQRIKRRTVRTKRPHWLTREGTLSTERVLAASGRLRG